MKIYYSFIKFAAFVLTLFGWAFASLATQTEPPRPLLLDMVYNNPGEAPTQSSFLDPHKLAAWGYSGQVTPNFIESSVTFDSFDPEIFPKDSSQRQWVLQHAQIIDQQLHAAHEAGIRFFPFTDFVVLPKSLVEKYADQILTKGRIDIHRPMTQKILRILIDEIFTRYPTLDGLVVRWGETYLVDIPYHTGGNPIIKGIDSQITLINLLREEICEKRGRRLIYRTWGKHFHTEPDYYLAVTDKIEPHPLLTFSIKYPKGDFHRMQPFNPTIGIGRHPQLIEVQCQPEAYGKCAHPYYIAQGVIDGWEELKHLDDPKVRSAMADFDASQTTISGLRDFTSQPQFAGIWTWSRGGGWQGPYIKNEFWSELNTYVISTWTRQPKRSEAEIFKEFAKQRVGLKGMDIDRFRRLCLLSAEAVLRGHMSCQNKLNIWWTRDQWIGGIDQLKKNIPAILDQNNVEPFLAEKAEAVAIWRRIESLARQLSIPDPQLRDFILTSCTYGRIKYEIFEKGWTVILLGQSGDRSGHYDIPRINRAIKDYDRLWNEWCTLKADHPSCATIYKDYYPRYEPGIGMFPTESGMGSSVDQYRTLTQSAK